MAKITLPPEENIEAILASLPKEPEKAPAEEPTVFDYSDEFLSLQNISCVDAQGDVFERYDEILLAKDILREPDGRELELDFYETISYFEQRPEGLFLPSFALTCNILAALYQNRDNPEIDKVLMQYKDHGQRHGWHAQNTVVNWEDAEIIHYPADTDHPELKGKNINQDKNRIVFIFNLAGLDFLRLKEALKIPNFTKYVNYLTGLQDPEILVEIGDYFNKPANVWAWYIKHEETRLIHPAFLGCGRHSFVLSAYKHFDYIGAIRGVKIA